MVSDMQEPSDRGLCGKTFEGLEPAFDIVISLTALLSIVSWWLR